MAFFRSLDVEADHIPANFVWDQPWYSEDNIRCQAWKASRPNETIRRYLERLNPDIVHVNDFPPMTVGITASRMGIPVIWHCRTVLLHTRPLLDPGRHIIDTITHHSDQIIGISEPETLQFNSNKAKTIYNPIEFSHIKPARGTGQALRQSLGIGNDEFVVIAPVPLSTLKGAWDFIEACGVAKKLAPHVRMKYLIVGSVPTPGRRHLLRKLTGWLGPQPYLERAYTLAQSVGIKNELMITGFRKDIYEIMDASDLIAFPSHMRACGRACFEAGALAKPIVVTMPDKNTRVVLDGVTGLIVPEKRPDVLGRTIARLALNPGEGKRMGQAGLDYVLKTFDAPTHAAKVMELYDRVLNQHDGKGSSGSLQR